MPVLDYQVAASADDGQYYPGGIFQNDTIVLYFGYYSAKVFARFVDVTIPKGAKITAAYMSFNVTDIYGTPPECALLFEKAANPSAVSSTSDGENRAITTNYIGYAASEVGWQDTADISAIIQELVDAYDYSAGSAMQMFYGGAPGTNYGLVTSYDGNSSLAPKLHIEYSLGERGTHSFRGMFRGMFNKMR